MITRQALEPYVGRHAPIIYRNTKCVGESDEDVLEPGIDAVVLIRADCLCHVTRFREFGVSKSRRDRPAAERAWITRAYPNMDIPQSVYWD